MTQSDDKNLTGSAPQEKIEDESIEGGEVLWEDLEPGGTEEGPTPEELLQIERGVVADEEDPECIPLPSPRFRVRFTADRKARPGLSAAEQNYPEVDLRTRYTDVVSALKVAHEQLRGGNGQSSGLWWRTDPSITPDERFFMESFFMGIEDIEKLSAEKGVTLSRMLSLVASASKKKWLQSYQEATDLPTGPTETDS